MLIVASYFKIFIIIISSTYTATGPLSMVNCQFRLLFTVRFIGLHRPRSQIMQPLNLCLSGVVPLWLARGRSLLACQEGFFGSDDHCKVTTDS